MGHEEDAQVDLAAQAESDVLPTVELGAVVEVWIEHQQGLDVATDAGDEEDAQVGLAAPIESDVLPTVERSAVVEVCVEPQQGLDVANRCGS